MTCPYCNPNFGGGLWMMGGLDPLAHQLGGYGAIGMQGMPYQQYMAALGQSIATPKTKLQVAKESAAEVRKHKPEMQVKRGA